ncbi:MAG: hypothetical protein KTR16_10145 [Acidiferrobacterales bacterium]|nr:hypothetical protein [Acidiferrobacterales bacterium]
MVAKTFVPLEREQFKLLRDAKRIIANEFGEDLSLQDPEILNSIYAYAKKSTKEELLNIFVSLDGKKAEKADASVKSGGAPKKSSDAKAKSSNEVKVGDIVDGKQCIGFYRGQPMFKRVAS